MLIRSIKDLINSRLAGETLTYSQQLPYLDAVVDDINSKLHTNFKVFSEVTTTDISQVYDEFPDKYIRTVVCVGAAFKWYTDDEEGIATAESLGQEYQNNLFIMERDYGPLIPTDKRRHDKGGFFCNGEHDVPVENFWNPDLRYIEKAGYDGDSVSELKIVNKEGARHLLATITSQRHGSRQVDCGIVSPDVKAFQIDAVGDIVVLMNDGTVYKAGGNLKELIMKTLLDINPIVSIVYSGYNFWAILLDGTKEICGQLYVPENAQRVFVTNNTPTPPDNAWDGDIWLEVQDVE